MIYNNFRKIIVSNSAGGKRQVFAQHGTNLCLLDQISYALRTQRFYFGWASDLYDNEMSINVESSISFNLSSPQNEIESIVWMGSVRDYSHSGLRVLCFLALLENGSMMFGKFFPSLYVQQFTFLPLVGSDLTASVSVLDGPLVVMLGKGDFIYAPDLDIHIRCCRETDHFMTHLIGSNEIAVVNLNSNGNPRVIAKYIASKSLSPAAEPYNHLDGFPFPQMVDWKVMVLKAQFRDGFCVFLHRTGLITLFKGNSLCWMFDTEDKLFRKGELKNFKTREIDEIHLEYVVLNDDPTPSVILKSNTTGQFALIHNSNVLLEMKCDDAFMDDFMGSGATVQVLAINPKQVQIGKLSSLPSMAIMKPKQHPMGFDASLFYQDSRTQVGQKGEYCEVQQNILKSLQKDLDNLHLRNAECISRTRFKMEMVPTLTGMYRELITGLLSGSSKFSLNPSFQRDAISGCHMVTVKSHVLHAREYILVELKQRDASSLALNKELDVILHHPAKTAKFDLISKFRVDESTLVVCLCCTPPFPVQEKKVSGIILENCKDILVPQSFQCFKDPNPVILSHFWNRLEFVQITSKSELPNMEAILGSPNCFMLGPNVFLDFDNLVQVESMVASNTLTLKYMKWNDDGLLRYLDRLSSLIPNCTVERCRLPPGKMKLFPDPSIKYNEPLNEESVLQVLENMSLKASRLSYRPQ